MQSAPEQAAGPGIWRWLWAPLALVAVNKGLRVPNLWAYSQSLFLYPGARRRSLLPHVLSLLRAHSYLAFTAFSAWLLVGLLLATGVLIWRSGLPRSPAAMLAAVFATSFALSYSAHLIGYTDNAVLLLVVLALLLRRRPALYLPAACFAAVACILTHENAAFFALPALALPPLLHALDRKDANGQASKRPAWIAFAAICAAGCAALAYLLLAPPLSYAQAQQLAAQMQQTVPFPLFPDLALLQSATPGMALRYMVNYYRTTGYWIDQAQATLALLPSATLFIYCAWRTLRGRRAAQLACAATALAPLLLHLLGWDVYRWDALVVWTSFLALVVTASRAELEFTPRLRAVALVLMVLNAAAGPGLMNGEPLHGFADLRQAPVALRMLAGRPQHSAYPDQPPPEPERPSAKVDQMFQPSAR